MTFSRKRLAWLASITLLGAASSTDASPPVGPSSAATRAAAAITDLSGFFGAWEGEESGESPRTRVYRQFVRSGPDHMVVAEYSPDYLVLTSLVTYNSRLMTYELLQPGYARRPPSDIPVTITRIASDGKSLLTWRYAAIDYDGEPIEEEVAYRLEGNILVTSRVTFKNGKRQRSFRAILQRTSVEKWRVELFPRNDR